MDQAISLSVIKIHEMNKSVVTRQKNNYINNYYYVFNIENLGGAHLDKFLMWIWGKKFEAQK